MLIILVAAALYLNSFAVPFLFDDHPQIVRNKQLERLGSFLSYLERPRGLVSLSLALNYHWGQLEVWGYHLFNVSLHAINGLLVYALVLSTLRLPFFGMRYVCSARVLASLVGIAFVAHPLQTMAATYIIQRAETMAALFCLLTFLLFIRGATAASKPGRTLAYGLALATTYLGMAAKETAATVPLIVLLYDLCFFSNGRVRAMRGRWLIYVGFVTALAYLLFVSWQHLSPGTAVSGVRRPDPLVDGTALRATELRVAEEDPRAGEEQAPGDERLPSSWIEIPTAGLQLQGSTPWHYLLTQFGVAVWYLRLYVLPTRLCFDYGWPLVDSPWRADVLLPFSLIVAIVVAGAASFRRYRLGTFCVGWTLLTLLPSSSVIPIKDVAFEHRMYLPLVGLAWLTVVGGYDGLRWLARRVSGDEAEFRWVGLGVATMWLGAMATLTVARNEVLQDPLALAADSAAKSPNNWRPHYDLGNELMARQRWDEATLAFQKAIACDPHQGSPRIHLSQLYVRRGLLAGAEAQLKAATHAEERSVVAAAYRQLGYLYVQQREWDDAMSALRTAASLMPRWSFVRTHLARLYARRGDWVAAANEWEMALRLNPALTDKVSQEAARAHFNAGVTSFNQHNFAHAARWFHDAARRAPRWSAAQHYLAITYAAMGQWARAQAAIEAATKLSPHDPMIAENRASIRTRRLPRIPGK